MPADERPPVSEAEVMIERAGSYLQQLCKHFGHKLPARCDDRQGRIEFPLDTCELEATAGPGRLTLRASAATAEDLAKLEKVVPRHLLRFAFRGDLQVAWSWA